MSAPGSAEAAYLVRRGLLLEYLTISWSILSAFAGSGGYPAGSVGGEGVEAVRGE